MVANRVGDGVPQNRRKADDSYCGVDRGGSVLPRAHHAGGFLFVCKSADSFPTVPAPAAIFPLKIKFPVGRWRLSEQGQPGEGERS